MKESIAVMFILGLIVGAVVGLDAVLWPQEPRSERVVREIKDRCQDQRVWEVWESYTWRTADGRMVSYQGLNWASPSQEGAEIVATLLREEPPTWPEGYEVTMTDRCELGPITTPSTDPILKALRAIETQIPQRGCEHTGVVCL